MRTIRFVRAAQIVVGLGAAHAAPGDWAKVSITYVFDGDTVAVAGSSDRIRLSSIDAPELSHQRGVPSQAFAQVSRQRLETLSRLPGLSMRCMDRDRYGRDVCEFQAGSVNVNRTLVAEGLAWPNLAARGRYLRDPELVRLQSQAKAAGRGLWSIRAAVPPWEWRDRCWKQQICPAEQ